jgi:hypothetical protein
MLKISMPLNDASRAGALNSCNPAVQFCQVERTASHPALTDSERIMPPESEQFGVKLPNNAHAAGIGAHYSISAMPTRRSCELLSVCQ